MRAISPPDVDGSHCRRIHCGKHCDRDGVLPANLDQAIIQPAQLEFCT